MRLRRTLWILGLSTAGVAIACDAPSSPAHSGAPLGRDASRAPRLLACPVDSAMQSPAVAIGALGGTLALGGDSIVIPPNAIAAVTDFQIVVPASQHMKVEIHAVGLSSFLFRQPATVTIDYSRCPASAVPAGATLQAVYVDSTGNVLQQMGGTVDSVRRRVTFTTGHLSGYAVAY